MRTFVVRCSRDFSLNHSTFLRSMSKQVRFMSQMNNAPTQTPTTPTTPPPTPNDTSDLKQKLYETAEYAYGSLNESKMMKDLKDLYVEMENRKYNMRWIVLSVAGLICYIFYGKITDWASDQAADVTSKYLENPKFKRDLLVFVEQTIDDLVKSERVQNDITRLLKETVVKLSDDTDVQNKLEGLFVRIFKSKIIKEAGSELSEDVVNQLLHSPKYEKIRKEAITYVVDELKNIVENKDLQQSVGMASWNAFKVWFGVTPTNNNNAPIVLDTTSFSNKSSQKQGVEGGSSIDKIERKQ